MPDYNAFGSSAFNAFRDSGFNARRRSVPFTLRFWFKFAELGAAFTMSIIRAPLTVSIEGGSIFTLAVGSTGTLFSDTDWNYFSCGYDGEKFFQRLNGGGLFYSDPLGGSGLAGFKLSLTWTNNVPMVPGDPDSRIDEVAIWKDRALSFADLDADYAAGAGLDFAHVDRRNLLAYWEMEGTTGVQPLALTDSLNGYSLDRFDSGVSSTHPIYDTGLFGNGIHNATGITGTFTQGTDFRTDNTDFTFGE